MHEGIEREARRTEIRNFLEEYGPMPSDPIAAYVCRVNHGLEAILYLLIDNALVVLVFNMKNTSDRGVVQRFVPLSQIREVILQSTVLPNNTSSYETGGSIHLASGEEFVLPDPDVKDFLSTERKAAVAFLSSLLRHLAKSESSE